MVKEITQPQLAGYSNPDYFYTAGGGVVFKTPGNGATTPGSSNPRTELRQMKGGGSNPASWSNDKQQWEMTCSLRFDHAPTGGNKAVVGMQVHDGVDDVTVLRRAGSDLYITKGDNSTYQHIATGITDATVLNMRVEARKGGGFYWYRDGVLVGSRGGTKSGCYFKAGCYPQNIGNDEYGQVTIFSLTVARTI